ncbi:hypothetical protein CsatA_014246 [Cannabis sativa]
MVRSSERIRRKKNTSEEKEADESAFRTIPEELVIQILIRLSDLRFLIQCTTVCKLWYSLITHDHQFIPNFVQFLNHRRRRQYDDNNYEIIMPYTILFRNSLYHDTNFYDLYSEESKIIHEDIVKIKNCYESDGSVRATYLDMLLVSGDLHSIYELYISNPLTKTWIPLPSHHVRRWLDCGFVAKPKIDRFDDNEQYNYKVVLFDKSYNNRIVRVMTFCSEIGEWSISSWLPYSLLWPNLVEYPKLEGSVASNNGIIYWLLKVGLNEVKGIFSCNPFKEEVDPKRFRFIEFPKICVETHRNKKVYRDRICIGIVKGQLRLSLIMNEGVSYFRLRIWELNNDDDEEELLWCLVHEVRLRKTTKLDRTFVHAFHPNNSDVIFLSRNYNLYTYQVREDKYKLDGRFPNAKNNSNFMKTCLPEYVRAFVLEHPPSSIPSPPNSSPWSI